MCKQKYAEYGSLKLIKIHFGQNLKSEVGYFVVPLSNLSIDPYPNPETVP